MQNPNPVIKNYILSPETMILYEKKSYKEFKNKLAGLKPDYDKISFINFVQR